MKVQAFASSLCEPAGACYRIRSLPHSAGSKMLVGRGGLEPPTSRLSGVRSNHLSYRPSEHCGEPVVLPLTPDHASDT